jgi:DNA-binding MarR family transcriptional regulator
MQKKFKILARIAEDKGIDVKSIEVNGHLFAAQSLLEKTCFKRLEEFDLLEGRFVAMLLINDAGQLAPHELAAESGLTRASITSVIDNLEKKGYVVRLPSPYDRRSIFVKMTEEGEKVLEKVTESQLKWLESTCENFTEEDKLLIISLLKKLYR